MTYRFALNGRLILVDAILGGPRGVVEVRLALDTGASRTQIVPDVLFKCGYDLSKPADRLRLNTSAGTVERFTMTVSELTSLGMTHRDFKCVVGELPKQSGIQGLLGLDHFSNRKLLIDFHRGRIMTKGPFAIVW